MAVQLIRPDSDISGFTQDYLGWYYSYTTIDETTASDADFIRGSDTTNNITAEVGLSNATDPSSSSGHTVRFRAWKQAGGFSRTLAVRLVQGSTVISTYAAFTLPESATSYNWTLSSAEADAITDYTDLRLRFTTGGTTGAPKSSERYVYVSWAEMEVPEAGAPAALSVNKSESVTVAESNPVSVSGPVVSKSESITVTDTPAVEVTTVVSDLSINKSEAISVTDTPTLDVSDLLITASESIDVTDTPGLALSVPTINVSEAVTAGDSASLITSDPQISVSDETTATDTPSLSTDDLTISVNDTLSAQDTNTLGISVSQISVQDSVGVGESAGASVVSLATLLSANKSYTYTSGKEPSSAYYPDTDTAELTDGTLGGTAHTDAAWMGFLSDGINGGTGELEFTIDLEAACSLSYVRIHFWSDGLYPNSGIISPETIVVYGSNNGTDFTQLDSFSYTDDWNESSATPAWTDNLAVSGSYRYVRFAVTGFAPVGGYSNWTFLSEAEVYGTTSTDKSVNVSEAVTVSENVSAITSDPALSVSDSSTVGESVDLSISEVTALNNSSEEIISIEESVNVSVSVVATLSISVSDSTSILENVSTSLSVPSINISDAVTVADSVAIFGGFPDNPIVSESVGVTDTPVLNIMLTLAVSDAVGVADNTTISLSTPAIGVSESISTADTPVVTTALPGISVSETITTTDVPSVVITSPAISVTQAVGVVDSPAISVAVPYIVVSEAVGVTDTPTVLGGFPDNPTVSDSVGVLDSPTVAVVAVSARAISVDDSVSVTESVDTRVSTPPLQTQDSVTVLDSPTVLRQAEGEVPLNINDFVAVAEAVSLVISAAAVSTSESITVTDTPSVAAAGPSILVSEVVGVLDSILIIGGSPDNPIVSDSVGVVDTPSLQINVPATSQEAVSVDENIILETSNPQINVSEDISVADSPSLFGIEDLININVSEDVTVSESWPGYTTKETVCVSELVIVEFPTNVDVSDAISVSESVSLSSLDRSISVTDSVSVTDAPQFLSLLELYAADGLIVVEDLPEPLVPEYLISVSSSVVVVDSVKVVNVYCIHGDEAISVVDSLTIFKVLKKKHGIKVVQSSVHLNVSPTPAGVAIGNQQVRNSKMDTGRKVSVNTKSTKPRIKVND